jgi:PIN domain nuclease of toxin-antitoxin system
MAAGQPDRLSVEARGAIENVHNELMFSSASLWEVAIKSMLRRPDFRVDARVCCVAAFSKTDMANWRSPGTMLSQS